MNFASDNVAGAHPALLQALADINDQTLNAYGEDPFNAQVEQECRRIFEHDRLKTVLVGTGSAANALALATMTPAWGAIYCHRTSHIVVDEANAVQAATAGARLVTLDGENGKIDPAELRGAIFGKGVIHHPQPAALSRRALPDGVRLRRGGAAEVELGRLQSGASRDCRATAGRGRAP